MMISSEHVVTTDLMSRAQVLDFKPEINVLIDEHQGFVIRDDFIKKASLLAELTVNEQQVLGQWMQLKQYAPDEILFYERSESDELYLIQEGWVKLYSNGLDSVAASFGPGNFLGGIDFFLSRPRAETARAVGEVKVWTLHSETLTKIIAQEPEIGLGLGLTLGIGITQFYDVLAGWLAQVPLLQDLSDPERAAMAKYLAPQRYFSRETIYRNGDSPTGIFLIQKGKIWLLSDDNDDYIELGPGDVFGDIAMISGKPHFNTAQAAAETIIWQLSPIDFATLTGAYPSIRAALSRDLGATLTETLAIASLIVEREADALSIVCGDGSDLVKKLHQVSHLLRWLKNSQALT